MDWIHLALDRDKLRVFVKVDRIPDSKQWREFVKCLKNYKNFKMDCSAWNSLLCVCWLGGWLVDRMVSLFICLFVCLFVCS